MNIHDLMALEGIEIGDGDFGVLFKSDGLCLGFGNPEEMVDLEDLYDNSPPVMMMLVGLLVTNNPVAEQCRKQLADEFVRTAGGFETEGMPN